MNVDKKHWLTNGAELIKSGDLVRLRGDDGEWGEWGSADHLAGSRADSFVQWHGMGVQFARVPAADKHPDLQSAAIATPLPAETDERAILREASEILVRQQIALTEQIAGLRKSNADLRAENSALVFTRTQLHRRISEMLEERSQWIETHVPELQGRHDKCKERVFELESQVGSLNGRNTDLVSENAELLRRVAHLEAENSPVRPAAQPVSEQPPAATTDRGERYRRTITQSLSGDTNGLSITVDIADVCEAFGLPCMLAQAAKKIMLPGERGSKDRLKDLREAAWHIQRQIQIEEARQQEAVIDSIRRRAAVAFRVRVPAPDGAAASP